MKNLEDKKAGKLIHLWLQENQEQAVSMQANLLTFLWLDGKRITHEDEPLPSGSDTIDCILNDIQNAGGLSMLIRALQVRDNRPPKNERVKLPVDYPLRSILEDLQEKLNGMLSYGESYAKLSFGDQYMLVPTNKLDAVKPACVAKPRAIWLLTHACGYEDAVKARTVCDITTCAAKLAILNCFKDP